MAHSTRRCERRRRAAALVERGRPVLRMHELEEFDADRRDRVVEREQLPGGGIQRRDPAPGAASAARSAGSRRRCGCAPRCGAELARRCCRTSRIAATISWPPPVSIQPPRPRRSPASRQGDVATLDRQPRRDPARPSRARRPRRRPRAGRRGRDRAARRIPAPRRRRSGRRPRSPTRSESRDSGCVEPASARTGRGTALRAAAQRLLGGVAFRDVAHRGDELPAAVGGTSPSAISIGKAVPSARRPWIVRLTPMTFSVSCGLNPVSARRWASRHGSGINMPRSRPTARRRHGRTSAPRRRWRSGRSRRHRR